VCVRACAYACVGECVCVCVCVCAYACVGECVRVRVRVRVRVCTLRHLVRSWMLSKTMACSKGRGVVGGGGGGRVNPCCLQDRKEAIDTLSVCRNLKGDRDAQGSAVSLSRLVRRPCPSSSMLRRLPMRRINTSRLSRIIYIYIYIYALSVCLPSRPAHPSGAFCLGPWRSGRELSETVPGSELSA
jgi:hypothetical protein